MEKDKETPRVLPIYADEDWEDGSDYDDDDDD